LKLKASRDTPTNCQFFVGPFDTAGTKKETARIRSFNNCVKTMMLESLWALILDSR